MPGTGRGFESPARTQILTLGASILKKIGTMNRLLILALSTSTVYSCTTGTKNTDGKTKIVITADSCKKWGLPPVNFEIEYPADFTSEINPTGGFYLQLRKVNGDTILQELSFGRVEGAMDDEKLKRNLANIDSVLDRTLNDHGQDYKTDFMGTDKFNETTSVQIRATLDLVKVTRDKFIAHGEYKSFMTCIYSPTSKEQAMIISVISSTKEPVDDETTLGITTSEILKSLKIR